MCVQVVELLTRETGSVTLAIGDGANDVAMIQKANVGVGITGLEGLQAACASDYAIGQVGGGRGGNYYLSVKRKRLKCKGYFVILVFLSISSKQISHSIQLNFNTILLFIFLFYIINTMIMTNLFFLPVPVSWQITVRSRRVELQSLV